MTAYTLPSMSAPSGVLTTEHASVVVASGGSDPIAPLQAARSLSGDRSGAVLAVSVLEPEPAYGPTGELILPPPEFEAQRVEAMCRLLHARLSVTFEGKSAGHRVAYGDPAHALAEIARREGARLLIRGIGHPHPIDRLLGAETTMRAVRRARCAVLAVPEGVTAKPRRVVIAVDFSDACVVAAREAMQFLASDATVYLVHCWQPMSRSDTRGYAHYVEYRDALVRRFAEYAARIDAPSGMTVHHATREGRPAERILAFARVHHADPIVAGRQRARLLGRVVVGSVTKRLLRATTCSLFVGRGRGPNGHDERGESLFCGLPSERVVTYSVPMRTSSRVPTLIRG